MSFNEYYVRNTNGSDVAGSGTSHATAYKTIQFAVDDIAGTHGKAAGDRLNLCSESPFVLASAINTANYANGASLSEHFMWQGYDTIAGDGGVFDIDLNGGAYALVNSARSYWSYCDGIIHNNSGSYYLLPLSGVTATALRLELYDNEYRAVGGGSYHIEKCNIHDCSGIGIYRPTVAIGNYLKNGTAKKFSRAIQLYSNSMVALYNIVSIDGASWGIHTDYHYEYLISNSVLSAGGTGRGVSCDGYGVSIYGNIVEGFSGAGGIGFLRVSGNFLRHNAAYNNETDYTVSDQHFHGPTVVSDPDNEVLPSSGFAKSGSDTFANRLTYFAPLAVGNTQAGYQGHTKGAVASAGGGSAGMLRRSNMRGGY